MQDYAKLYRWRYQERRSTLVLNKIRRLIRSKLSPEIMLLLIIAVVLPGSLPYIKK